MSQPRATVRAFCAGAVAGLAVVLAIVGLVVLASRGADDADAERPPQHMGGAVVLAVPDGGHVLIDLPAGWGITRQTAGTLTLSSPRTCHTATLNAFVDRSGEPPRLRGPHLLGYLSGREFDAQRLWRGTTADGQGYAVYDPALLVGVEVVRDRSASTVVVLHGLPTHEHCSRHDAAAPRWELSRLLQDLRVLAHPGRVGP